VGLRRSGRQKAKSKKQKAKAWRDVATARRGKPKFVVCFLPFAFCSSKRPDVCGGISGEAKSKKQKAKA